MRSPLYENPLVSADTQPAWLGTDRGPTIWFTGLSSAGKSTIANEVQRWLAGQQLRAEVLDGDVMRQHLCSELGFSKEQRDTNIRRIGFVAELLSRNGVIVLVATISPYRSQREEMRKKIPRLAEVYVNAPLQVCEDRDVKGLYKRARAGELLHFTGIDDPYETPLTPELECHTNIESVEESASKVMDLIARLRQA